MSQNSFNLTIKHSSEYSFSKSVFLEPHTLFFRPSPTPYYVVDKHHLKISPNPQGSSWVIGAENQQGCFCWFSEPYKHFHVYAESNLKVTSYNPFGFLIYPSEYACFPFHYPKELSLILNKFLVPEDIFDNELTKYVNTIKTQSHLIDEDKLDVVSLLWECTQSIHQDFSLEVRELGAPQAVKKTYAKQRGSCRDIAHLQITILRFLGIASRFVSGYLYIEVLNKKPKFELHAWVEVFIPGAGWIGLDPSHGVFVDHHYIPVTRSVQHDQTLPITGSYRGSVKSKLVTDLVIIKSNNK